MIKIYLSNTLQEDLILFIKQLYIKGIKLCIKFKDQQYVEEYSKILWNQRVFLPHAIIQDAHPSILSIQEWYNRQTIFLTTYDQDNLNHASTCIYVDCITNQIETNNIFFCHINNIDIITQLKQHKNICYIKTNTIWNESKI